MRGNDGFYLTYHFGQLFQRVLDIPQWFGYNGSMLKTDSPTMNTNELMAQLAIINKTISQMEYNDAIISNKGNVKMVSNIVALDNLEVDAIQNQKYIDRIISVNASIDFLSNGGIITRCKTVVNKRMKRMYNV
jgi:hypothetical protein